jgi:predicted PurR-regulated permease PerM
MVDHGSYVQKALGLALLFLLLAGCALVLRPFLAAILWAAILAVSTWPVYVRVERFMGGYRTPAALVMTLLLASLLLVPFLLLGISLTENVVRLAGVVRSAMAHGPLPPPGWLTGLPLVGGRLEAFWLTALRDADSLRATVQAHIGGIEAWLLARGGDLGAGVLQLSLSLLTAFFFYRNGPNVVQTGDAVVTEIAGNRSQRLCAVAAGTINGVVRGLLGTALIQALLCTIGYWIAGVPAALLLGFLSFFLSFIPLGLAVVWLPAALWLASQGDKDWALFIALWGFVVGMIDNFLRPYLIGHGTSLPFLLLLLGMFGGAASFGLVGLFLGPTLLAIAHSLLQEWSNERSAAADAVALPRGGAASSANPALSR